MVFILFLGVPHVVERGSVRPLADHTPAGLRLLAGIRSYPLRAIRVNENTYIFVTNGRINNGRHRSGHEKPRALAGPDTAPNGVVR